MKLRSGWSHLAAVALALGGSLVLANAAGLPGEQAQQGQQGQQTQQGRAQGQGQQQGQTQQGRGGGGQGRGAATRDPSQSAQTPPPTGTGAISGSVILDGPGSPVRRARMTLTGQELRGQRNATTDDQGHFSFAALPAGRFTLTASKTGYLDTSYGAKEAGRPGTPIQLADGQSIEKLTIRMPKGSVLTGTVIDENGEPSPLTQVRAMKFVMRTGEKTLQQIGQGGLTDDRGVYRIFGLQPGDYIISAVPRTGNISDVQQAMLAAIESLQAQGQALNGATNTGRGGGGAASGGGGGGGRGANGAINALLGGGAGGGRGQQFLDQAAQLQQQLTQTQQQQSLNYAPVYYPGTPAAQSATTLSLGIAEEHSGVDFQLQLVQTAKVAGTINFPGGQVPQGTQVVLTPVNQGLPPIPGVGNNMTRVLGDGKFSFSNVAPGQYTVSARAVQRTAVDPNQPAQAGAAAANGRGGRGGFGGPGGRGGPGGDVLWAAADVNVAGQDIEDLSLTFQEGMTLTGHVEFRGSSQPPTDLTTVRITVSPQGQQLLDNGPGIQPVQADASGTFSIKGVPPGKYVLRGSISAGGGRGGFGGGGAGGSTTTTTAGGGRGGGGAATPGGAAPTASWTLKSSMVNGRDTLDFPLDLKPNESPSGVLLSFTDKTQTLSGTLQDSSGRPTSDYTIIVFSSDKQYWTPQSRRISSTRPGTDGTYSFRGLPAGQYRITAVTDVEPGEWFDPDFLTQLSSSSIPLTLGEGETKTQDLKLSGSGTGSEGSVGSVGSMGSGRGPR